MLTLSVIERIRYHDGDEVEKSPPLAGNDGDGCRRQVRQGIPNPRPATVDRSHGSDNHRKACQ